MPESDDKPELDTLIDSYYQDEPFTAVMHVKIDTKYVEQVAAQLRDREEVVDLFLVMGDTDFIAKIKTTSYGRMKNFLVNLASEIEGIKDTKTLNVVTTYKEGGEKVD